MHAEVAHAIKVPLRVTMTPQQFQRLSGAEQRNIKSVYPALGRWQVEYYPPSLLQPGPEPKKAPGISPRLLLKILGYGEHHK